MTEPSVPAEAFDARGYVRDELAARGMGADALPVVARNWLADPARPMTGPVTLALARTFDTSQAFWRNLDRRFRAEYDLAATEPDGSCRRLSAWVKHADGASQCTDRGNP